VKRTAFRQFCGGEQLEDCIPVIERLARQGILSILDYGVEAGDREQEFDDTTEEKISILEVAAQYKTVVAIASKISALARFELLEKIDRGETLSQEEHAELDRVRRRLERICQAAAQANTAVLIDAEESWMQNAMDMLTEEMMARFNKTKAVIYQTIQLYRTDRLAYLKTLHQRAQQEGFICGVKLVRGAYMEKERKRAAQRGYPSPIHATKADVDRDYNAAMAYCLDHPNIWFVAGTHNEESSRLLADWVDARGINRNEPRVNTCQLYGMSDHITYNLAHAGFTASKLIPYGRVRDVIPYLTRRAQENTSAAGQMGRELHLLKSELQRRKAQA
jgi:proline dehydrogenase